MEEMGNGDLLVVTPQNLKQYTNDFSNDNFIGETHFGKLYRGTLSHGSDSEAAHHVTVKIWENPPPNDPSRWCFDPWHNKSRLMDEEVFLTHPSVIKHPNLVKLIGTCRDDGSLGVVYDLNPWDTLHNLVVSDIFSWPQRIKVSLGFASLLDYLHGQDGPYMVRNIDAAHILIDKECNPLLCDFSMLNGGVLGYMPWSDEHLYGRFGYMDVNLAYTGDGWSTKCDVFSYGCVLLSLIAKRVVDKNDYVYMWAKEEYKSPKKKKLIKQLFERKVAPKCSIVHKSLEDDPYFDARDGPIITDLAMSCVEDKPSLRPTMNEVVQKLQGLHAVKSRGEAYSLQTKVARNVWCTCWLLLKNFSQIDDS